jgi:hypothetical protein
LIASTTRTSNVQVAVETVEVLCNTAFCTANPTGAVRIRRYTVVSVSLCSPWFFTFSLQYGNLTSAARYLLLFNFKMSKFADCTDEKNGAS